jgi:hypothetical protein
MPNVFKYSTSVEIESLQCGNIYLGVGDVGKGPSESSGFYNGISPPTNGYTIYAGSFGNLPAIYCANNTFQLVNFTNGFSNESFTGEVECLNWYVTQPNFACVNRDYESITTNSLTFLLDAGFTASYSKSGSTWYDLSSNNFNAVLYNDPTYLSSSGGVLDFDGVNNYASSNLITSSNDNITMEAWFNCDNVNQAGQMIFYNGSDSNINGYGFSINTEGTTSGNLYVLYGGLSWFDTGVNLTSNTWYQVDMTISGTNLKVFLNGSKIYTTTFQNPNTPTSYTEIGRNDYPAARYFNGKISNVKFWDRVLSDSEILSNYSVQLNRFVTPTPTPTPTLTPTPTPTVTPTYTPSQTVTPTYTPTSTVTPTLTPTPTNINAQGFSYNNFASTEGLTAVGNASVISNIYYLTTANNSQVGNVYRTTAIRFDRNFSAKWSTFIGGGTGADGYCIQWTPTNNTNGSAGGGVGYVSTAINAITFLTYTNDNYTWYKNNVAQVTTSVSNDFWRQTLYFWGDYNHSSQTFDLYWNTTNGKPVTPNKTFTSFVFNTSNYYMGFGAATGGLNDNHQLLSWALTFT